MFLLICLKKFLLRPDNIFIVALSYCDFQMISLIFNFCFYIISSVVFAAKAKNPCFRIVSSNRVFDIKQMGNAILDPICAIIFFSDIQNFIKIITIIAFLWHLKIRSIIIG